MTATLEEESIALDSVGHLGFAASLILRDLSGKRKGKCPCHIVATTALPEHLTYEFLAELLSRRWVEIHLPTDAPAPLVEHVRKATGVGEADVRRGQDVWIAFFRGIGASELAPRYYVRLTKLGKQVLAQGKNELCST